ncbi:hypothetical protein C8J55DRAFT_586308 [Lentinula edodes]|uniref:Uncharacterized protein n=1 Tax=Lentinula lateritia TaxID=40482 RepID=A0A9W9E0C9_9AGAR|nr:hypothetical protein C8J55DRAFT_586308 [Lentinula edodes]
MTSLIRASAEAAHSLAVSLLSKTQIQPGATVPEHSVKESTPNCSVPLTFSGKSVILIHQSLRVLSHQLQGQAMVTFNVLGGGKGGVSGMFNRDNVRAWHDDRGE